MKRWLPAGALALQLFAEALAGADTPPAPVTTSPPPSPKQPVPDYDGRGPPRKPAFDAALWVPRILLSPLYLVSEYVIRAPLAVVIPAAENADVPTKVYDFFAFGPDHKAGIVPVGLFEFDFNPSVGVYAFWNDALGKGNDWALHTEAWPSDWYAVSLRDSVRLDDERTLLFHLSGVHRPDRVFYGLGPRSLQSNQSRYTQAVTDESVMLDWKYARGSHLMLTSGIRSASLGPGSYGSDPSLGQEAAIGAFSVPAGYGGRYTAQYNQVLASLDSRRPLPAPGSGARVEIKAEQGSDLISSPASGWIRYGGTASGFLDLDQHQRVINLSVSTEFADPLGNLPIPFTELVSLGGDGPMRGYFVRRMVDRSAATAALHYVWPIGPWLGGNIEAAVGNVFGEHLQGFRPDLLRFSTDVGITTVGVGDYPIEAVFGVGSETFEHGGQIDSIRAMISVNHGFLTHASPAWRSPSRPAPPRIDPSRCARRSGGTRT